ncbi:MAG: cytochrome c [Anaerolineales bacterium]|nr:MAG: cytochrome c [Anaerolineales bacterium]
MNAKTRRGLLILLLLFSPFVIALLLTYQVITIPFPSDLIDSLAVGYQEGPRLKVPADSIPLQGVAVIPDEFPVNPVENDDVSLQRGEILYGIHCALCHGDTGHGDGPLAAYFSRTPARLSGSKASAEFDGTVYLMVLQGVGEMPSLAENLTVRERWDVINYIRSFATETD